MFGNKSNVLERSVQLSPCIYLLAFINNLRNFVHVACQLSKRHSFFIRLVRCWLVLAIGISYCIVHILEKNTEFINNIKNNN